MYLHVCKKYICETNIEFVNLLLILYNRTKRLCDTRYYICRASHPEAYKGAICGSC